MAPAYSLWAKRQAWGKPNTATLDYNMADYRTLQCRDPRDRIFSMLAISSDAKELDIQPDYSATNHVGPVYLHTTVRILQTSRNLNLLPYVCSTHNESDESQPSWALNVPISPFPTYLPWYLYAPHPQSTPLPPLFREKNSVLVVKGRILDRIAMSATPRYSTPSYATGIEDASYLQTQIQDLSIWTRLMRLHQSTITLKTAGSLCLAIMAQNPARALAAHATRSPTEQAAFYMWSFYWAGVELSKSLASRLGLIINEIDVYDALLQDLAAALKPSVDVTSLGIIDSLTIEYNEALTEVTEHLLLEGRAFSVTDQGISCNAMNGVKQGDVIAAFQGTERLYVLRQVGHQYRLVGDAMVPGMMLGEAYQGLDPGKVDYEIELI